MQELVVPERKIESTNEIFFLFFVCLKLTNPREEEEEDMGFITWKAWRRGDSSSGKLIQWFCGELLLVLAYIPWKKNSETSNKSGVELTKDQKL